MSDRCLGATLLPRISSRLLRRAIGHLTRLVLAGIFGSLLAGCAGAGGELRYYLIDPAPVPVLRDAGTAPVVEILDLDVPQYLERFQIASRGPGNRIDYALNDQWGEPLRKNLLRTLAINLSTALETVAVATPINRLSSTPELRVQVHMERFETAADGRTRLDARWQVIDVASGRIRTEQVELASPSAARSADIPDRVAAMQALFAELSSRIAASLLAQRATGEGDA